MALRSMQAQSQISIPFWCDWESDEFTVPAEELNISIPFWCDWESFGISCYKDKAKYFNSILVRLGGANLIVACNPFNLFQFHFGAIGRIALPGDRLHFTVISIPFWCDWESIVQLFYRSLPNISIPFWCDWEYQQFPSPFQ